MTSQLEVEHEQQNKISAEEVSETIKMLKKGKDNITGEMLKNMGEMQQLFTNSSRCMINPFLQQKLELLNCSFTLLTKF